MLNYTSGDKKLYVYINKKLIVAILCGCYTNTLLGLSLNNTPNSHVFLESASNKHKVAINNHIEKMHTNTNPIAADTKSPLQHEAHYKRLDSIVTTGNALATDVSKIPGNISTVNEQEINTTTNNKITDIVKKLVSVRIDNDVSFNPRPKIKIRGINYGALIMLDGVILTDLEGENRLLNQISLYDVKRVEVARGAFSSLYGTNAIGGVINFITAMPNKFEVEALAGYGNEFIPNTAEKNLTRLYFSVGNAFLNKKLRIKLSAGMNNSQGYTSTPVYLTSKPDNISGGYFDKAGRYIIGDEGRREWQIWDTRLKIEYDLSDTSMLSSMFSVSNHNYTFVNPRTLITDSNGKPVFEVPNNNSSGTIDPFVGSGYGGYGSYTHFLGNIVYMKYFDEGELRISLSSVNLFSRWIDGLKGQATRAGGLGYTQDIYTSSNYLDVLYHTHINEQHNIATALQLRYLNFDSPSYHLSNWKDKTSVNKNAYRGYGGMSFVASSYLNWEAEWLDSLSTTLGLRYDYWLNFQGYVFGALANDKQLNLTNNHTSQISPKFSLNYMPFSWWILKTSVGTGFRMPTLREQYQASHGGIVWLTSPNLKPETGISFEVGTEFNTDHGNLSLYYFQTELFNMIYRQGTGIISNPFAYANAGYGRINGVELSFQIPIWKSLRFDGNYTLTLARVLKNPSQPESIGKQLVDTPEHMANISLNYGEDKGLYASLWAYFTSAFYNDDINSLPLYRTFGEYDAQFTLNAKLGYIFKNSLDLSMSFLNMTNNRYYDFYRVAGASFYIQARYKFAHL
ncbi:TonB-dependent receptor [Helicobacter trogontum]|uniref:TonB-dependent receptor n=1 Tax=Helicobacter trogontum TaxID=50960 RepID=A0A4U8TGQ2_9HELI|nr:TonB-dependent receptor [Helicobacter trogontum]MDY5185442.1 TonB-dependent receptor [Helicobacter trogontum]TLD99360.1 TonB-dependent receptor [Helicobacter trogontum]SFZ72738.1 OMP1675 [Helicobacter trogontum]